MRTTAPLLLQGRGLTEEALQTMVPATLAAGLSLQQSGQLRVVEVGLISRTAIRSAPLVCYS